MKPPRIAYVQGGAPDGVAGAALYRALQVDRKLSTARTIVVKLNLCAAHRYSADGGVCVATAAVVEFVASLRTVAVSARIIVGDSDSIGHGFAHDKFVFQGLDSAAMANDFELLDFSRDRTVLVPCEGEFFKQIPLAQTVVEADVFVSFSKIKTHNLTRVTGALKNCFGLLPTAEKQRYHPYLDVVLADIFQAKPPDLAVLDGRPAMEGNGPVHGVARDLGITLLGNDALATDAEMSRLMGIAPRNVGHLRCLAQRLDRSEFTEADNVGETLRPRLPAFAEISSAQKFLIGTGLKIQAIGANVEELGHLVHCARNISDARRLGGFVKRVVRKGRLF